MKTHRWRSSLTGLVLLMGMVALSACNGSDPESPGDAATMRGAGAKETDAREEPGCDALPTSDELQAYLARAPRMGQVGGFSNGLLEWGAVVDREGRVCAVAPSVDSVYSIWPGSQAIAVAKAYTANAFSNDKTPMSTARLYTMSQPGYSLYGAAAGNPLDPDCLVRPGAAGAQVGEICGGTIVFGGGVPLYRDGNVVGGLGVSGDTPCADHEIAKRVREQAGLIPPGGNSADEIVYAEVDSASVFAHPICTNTWRNGQRIGEPVPVPGYPTFAR